MKNKFLKYTLRAVLITIGIYLLLLMAIYIYISSNKKSIVAKVTTEINDKIQGIVSIDNIDVTLFTTFPSFAVQIQNITIKDSLYAQHGHTFFTAKNVYAKLSFLSLIKRKPEVSKLVVEKASLYLFKDSTGYTNENLLNRKKPTTAIATAKDDNSYINKIELRDVHFTKEDKQKSKLFDFVINNLKCNTGIEKDEMVYEVQQDILVKSLAFNTDKGSFVQEKTLNGKFKLYYKKETNFLHFNNIQLAINKQPFVFTGQFLFTPINPTFNLQVSAKNILYADAKSLVTPSINKGLSVVSLEKPLDVEAIINGPLNAGEPLIKANFTVKNNSLKTPLIDFEKTSFTGSFTNQIDSTKPRNDINSKIELQNFIGDWNGLIFNAKEIIATNIENPTVKTELIAKATLQEINDIIGSDALQLISGNAALNISYSGPLIKNTTNNTFANGNIIVSNGEILYGPKNIPLHNCTGIIEFKNSDVFVHKLSTDVLGNNITMFGYAKNLLELIDKDAMDKAEISWSVTSPKLNLEKLIPLFSSQGKVVNKSKGKTAYVKTAKKIDALLEHGNLKLNAKTNQLIFQKFVSQNVEADIVLKENKWIIQKATLQHAGGSMNVQGMLSGLDSKRITTTANVTFTNVDIEKLLYSFNNFGQDGITYKNIEGKFSANANIVANMNNQLILDPESINGRVNFSIKNGKLIQFEPLYKLQDFVFKKRNFEEITFAELKNTLNINNQEVTINRMEIQSSVLSLFVEGIYSLKGNTDISIQLPLSNFKKRKADFTPENIGAKKGGGMSVFVRAKADENGKIKFKYDAFKRFRKEDVEEKTEKKKKN